MPWMDAIGAPLGNGHRVKLGKRELLSQANRRWSVSRLSLRISKTLPVRWLQFTVRLHGDYSESMKKMWNM